MLENIKAHSIMVERVASLIAMEIKKTGADISMAIVTAGALLHDIGKTPCLNTGEDHAAMGSRICIENDLAGIAGIVREHVILEGFDPEGNVNEKEIIYYADKRVNHDKLVSLDERLEYLLIRYAKGNKRVGHQIEENFKQCREVEKKIFSLLWFRPEDIVDMI
ncbi:MAG: HDIG domain-containing protein [Deltaproteobacteria bacterium]|nr:HDIG domain-containing protein [Deltaproteobacteria bacterium]